jgi:hypothetical protein
MVPVAVLAGRCGDHAGRHDCAPARASSRSAAFVVVINTFASALPDLPRPGRLGRAVSDWL